MRKICQAIGIIFGIAYLLALALLIIGTFGLFGQERTALAGVFLAPLGLPWNLLLDPVPDTLKPWLAALTPALNLLILRTICRAIGSAGS